MPEAAHYIIGMSILIPLFYITDGKFNKKVAIIFLINNWIGPDLGQVYSKLFGIEDAVGIDFHWFIPFMFFAIPMGYFYSYMSRFSVTKTSGAKGFLTIKDDVSKDVSWRNAYLLCLSGGLLHTIADAIFTMWPNFSSFITFNVSLDRINGDLILISITLSHSSVLVSMIFLSGHIPALLTNISIVLNLLMV